jgi:hypothetical protein
MRQREFSTRMTTGRRAPHLDRRSTFQSPTQCIYHEKSASLPGCAPSLAQPDEKQPCQHTAYRQGRYRQPPVAKRESNPNNEDDQQQQPPRRTLLRGRWIITVCLCWNLHYRGCRCLEERCRIAVYHHLNLESLAVPPNIFAASTSLLL